MQDSCAYGVQMYLIFLQRQMTLTIKNMRNSVSKQKPAH